MRLDLLIVHRSLYDYHCPSLFKRLFNARRIHSCPIILCASPKLLDKYGTPNSPQALTDYPAIIYSKHTNEDIWRYSTILGEKNQVKLNRKMTTNTAEMVVHSCLAGISIAAIPIFACTNYLKTGELVKILPQYKTNPQSEIYIVYKSKEYISTRLRLFIEHLMEFRSHLSW